MQDVGDKVFCDYTEYKCRKARIELWEMQIKADTDVNAGRIAPMEDTFINLRVILKEKLNG